MHVLDPIGFVEPRYGEEEILLLRCVAVVKEAGCDAGRDDRRLVRCLRKRQAKTGLREAADRNDVLRAAQRAPVEPPVHVELALLEPLLGLRPGILVESPQDVPS